MKLYEIAGEYREIQAALEEAGGELTQEIEARLNVNQETLAQKLENIAKLDAELQAYCAACMEEVARLKALASSRERASDSLRAYALCCLQAAGIKKVETPLFIISRQANPARVVIDDEESIPIEFFSFSIDKKLSWDEVPEAFREDCANYLNKAILKKYLETHPEITIPGVHLEAGESLRIK